MAVALKQLNTDLFGEPLDALPPQVAAVVELLSRQGDVESRGEVYTRPEVVEFILDLVGYTEDQPLHLKRVLEPSFGGGEFLLACIERLLTVWRASNKKSTLVEDLADSICAVELHRESFFITREVSTYPAITVISRKKGGATRVACRPSVDRVSLAALAAELRSKHSPAKGSRVREQSGVVQGDHPWLFGATDKATLLRRLEQTFPTLEEAGCKVGIGVATGADKAFIGAFDELDVEPDRKLPLVTTRDIQSGEVCWRGQGVINPFDDSGGLVDLHRFPRLRRYLEARENVIAKRHCAQKIPANWYRTIDRIQPDLALRPKLLIPDIKGAAHIVFEPGTLYPHHNLYYIVSEAWDLRALQAVLLSSIVRLTMTTYSTQMRGGYLRFQAQYLRRIRLPHWQDVPENVRLELADAATRRDFADCNRAAFKLYGLTEAEQVLLNDNGEPHGT